MYDPPTLALRFKSDIITWTEYEGAATEEWHNMEPGKYCGFIILINMRNGEIIGLMNDGVLHHIRVGATAGVGAKYLSRKNSAVLGVVGSGGMAETYAEAICHVRPIEEIRVYSPTPAHPEAYAERMSVYRFSSKRTIWRSLGTRTLSRSARIRGRLFTRSTC